MISCYGKHIRIDGIDWVGQLLTSIGDFCDGLRLNTVAIRVLNPGIGKSIGVSGTAIYRQVFTIISISDGQNPDTQRQIRNASADT